jgi:hypothetical protein
MIVRESVNQLLIKSGIKSLMFTQYLLQMEGLNAYIKFHVTNPNRIYDTFLKIIQKLQFPGDLERLYQFSIATLTLKH